MGYLFYFGIVNLYLIVLVVIASIFVITIIITQSGNYDLEQRLTVQEQEQKKLIEKLKIYEQLIGMKVEIKELQKRFKK